jgi:hypothetical protein
MVVAVVGSFVSEDFELITWFFFFIGFLIMKD